MHLEYTWIFDKNADLSKTPKMVKMTKNGNPEKAEILDLCMDSKNAQKWIWSKSIKMEFFQKSIFSGSTQKMDKFGILIKNGILGPSDIP